MSALVLDVTGHPAPQGSKTAVTRGKRTVLIEDNPRTKPWREHIKKEVQRLAAGRPPIAGPVALACLFSLPPSAGARHEMKMGRRVFPDTIYTDFGDLDKLIRALCDGLSAAGVWQDDARVVRLASGKDWPGAPGFMPVTGVRFVIVPVASDYVADLITVWVDELAEAGELKPVAGVLSA